MDHLLKHPVLPQGCTTEDLVEYNEVCQSTSGLTMCSDTTRKSDILYSILKHNIE